MFDRLESTICLERPKEVLKPSFYPRTSLDIDETLDFDCYRLRGNMIIMPYSEIVIKGQKI